MIPFISNVLGRKGYSGRSREVESYKLQNPVKQMNKNLGINRYTLFDILNIIEYSPSENYLIKGVKKNNPC